MKYLLTLTLLFLCLLSFYSCGDDNVVNNNGGDPTADFDVYLGKFSQQPLRYSSYTIKSDGTALKLFNDSMAVGASSGNNKILLAKIDSTGSSLKVYSADYDGTNMKYIPTGSYQPVYFDLSTDGTKALFTTDIGNYMFIINSDGTGLRQLSDGIRGTETVPKFSHECRKIAFFEAPQSLETALYTINTDGTGKKMLMDSIYYSNDYSLDWSPDGTKILFQYNKNNLNEQKICTIDTSGINLIDLAEGVNPAYSPNGNKICFKKNVNQGIYDLFIMNPDGSGVVNITNSLTVYESTGYWSPDGTKIMYLVQNAPFSSEIKIYDINTTETRILINSYSGAIWK